MELSFLIIFWCLTFCVKCVAYTSDKNSEEDNGFYKFLSDSFQKDEEIRRAPLPKERNKVKNEHEPVKLADTVQLPGGYNPLPGRTSFGDYWPLMPMSNQYHAAVTYDTSKGRHVGGDILIPVPYWNNFLNIGGHYIERFQEEWVKVGYINSPVNMLGLTKDQIARLLSDPSLHYNRQIHPKLPVGALPREYEPIACKPPLCNPYQGTLGVGVEANYHIEDGVEGELDLPIPIGKDIAYRFPLSGNIHYDHDDTSVNYGQHLSPLDPLFPGFPDENKPNKRTFKFQTTQ
ncbi:uncharacterized protein CELE_C26B9.2 [Caenorhabditis elegans]|uniref:Uncharacterized protein n=1 Tax=Caenorhabditis elegans TaxID=6239 RepID=Q18201_CAEEL|nr:Uncharacterized protein CELE_C26B9.2 [Caenorhabditis elegans]CCD65709.2 Uncharacterized protein CELE_C26B9.2 [Caenorhabditis elegans]|eukprot:NP_508906.2 Uncharacterized protein CELE_C26B9.2 [Caenorhabditis elegans]